jgi:hypothetical protein
MNLPRQQGTNRLIGTFTLHVEWVYEWLPESCVSESRIKRDFTWDATTSQTTDNVYERWWTTNGPIPPSKEGIMWRVSTKCEGASLRGMVLGEEGYRFFIAPEYVKGGKPENTRGEFRLHPDGPRKSEEWTGSWGCIVFFPESEAKRLRSCLSNLRDEAGLLDFPLIVHYNPV